MSPHDKESFEIRFHGRGGQGVVYASTVMAVAFAKEGKFVQAFPSFGAERRGAPVVSYTRVSGKEIKARFGIYEPDIIIVLDANQIREGNAREGLKKGGWIIVDSSGQKPQPMDGYRVATINATEIARKFGLGDPATPIINTIMLGAFAGATGLVSLDNLIEAIRENAPSKPEQNILACQEAYNILIQRGSEPLSE